MKNKTKLYLGMRWGILAIILGVSMLIHWLHLTEGVKYPSIHSICPFGGLENLWAFLAGRVNISKIFSGTMILFFLTVVFALLFRRTFCGNICPFGALQEFLGKLVPKKFKVPAKIDKYLLFLKYIVLIFSVVMAWITMSLWISPYDPWAAFGHIYRGVEMFSEFTLGAIILIIISGLSLITNRPFCKYLCPSGALYGLIGKLSPSFVKRYPDKCINCKKCTQTCPVDIKVHTMEKVSTAECISCGICVEVCPEPQVMIASQCAHVRIKPIIILLLSVGLFFGTLFVLDRAGIYKVAIPSQQEIIENKNYLSIGDLRGSMTIEAGAFYTGKNLDDFYKIMEIPRSVPINTLLKNVQFQVPGYDFHVMKAKKALE